MQNNKLTAPLEILDRVLARNAGINTPVFYEFPSLLDSSEAEQAEVAYKKVQTATLAVGGPVMTEEEARDMLDGDSIIGNLEEDTFDMGEMGEDGTNA